MNIDFKSQIQNSRVPGPLAQHNSKFFIIKVFMRKNNNDTHEPSHPPFCGQVRPHPSFTLGPGLAWPSPSFPFGWAPGLPILPLLAGPGLLPLLGRGQPRPREGRANPHPEKKRPTPTQEKEGPTQPPGGRANLHAEKEGPTPTPRKKADPYLREGRAIRMS